MHAGRQGRTASAAAALTILAFGLAGVASAPAGGATPDRSPQGQRPDRVVVVAVPGLGWRDLSPAVTPNLWRFSRFATRGLLSVKTASVVARCASAMTTLGAGNRAEGVPGLDGWCAAPDPAPPVVTPATWEALVKANRRSNFGTIPGLLGATLRAHGVTVAAAGAPGAILAAAGRDGRLLDGAPAATATVTIVEDPTVYAAAAAQRRTALAVLDARVARYTSGGASVLTIVVGAGDDARGGPSLRVAMAAGPGFSGGRLTSDSTARAPYVELIDVAPTVLSALGLSVPTAMAGQPWQRVHGRVAVSDLVDATRHAERRWALGGWFVSGLVVIAGLVIAAAATAVARGRQTPPLVELACYFTAAVPVCAYLLNALPWWRLPAVAVGAAVGVGASVVAGAAWRTSRRWPPWGGVGLVAGLTAAVLTVDFATGTHLQLDGIYGDATVVAGRFAGAGNTAFAVFAVTVLVALGLGAEQLRGRGRRGPTVAVVVGVAGAAAVVVDGAPGLGNDLGGVLALAPAVVLLAVLAAGRRVQRRVWLAAGAAAVAAGATVLGYDLVAGGGHIGRFAGGSGGGIHTTVDRRLAAMLQSWHTSVYVVAVVIAVVAVISVRAPVLDMARRRPALAGGFAAAAVCAVLGGVLNDSGAVVTGAAAVVGAPLLLAGVSRATR